MHGNYDLSKLASHIIKLAPSSRTISITLSNILLWVIMLERCWYFLAIRPSVFLPDFYEKKCRFAACVVKSPWIT